MEFDPENPFQFTKSSDRRTTAMAFLSEISYKPQSEYHIIPNMIYLRNQASAIFQQYAATGARDPVIPYLALIYFDLFVSVRGVPNSQGIAMGDNNRIPLFVTCCFIVAWKMRKPVFYLPDFLIQYNLPYLIDEIENLEPLIDSWLQHRHVNNMPIAPRNVKRPVTAFCFLDYLIGLLTKFSNDETLYLKSFATHKLYALQYNIQYTLFKPSIVAAAAITFCVNKYYGHAVEDVLDTFLTCGDFNNENLQIAIEFAVPGLIVETGIEYSSDDDDDNSDDNDDDNSEKAVLIRNRLKTIFGIREELHKQTAVSSSLAAANTQSLKIVPPDRIPGARTSPAQLMLSAPDRSSGAHTRTAQLTLASSPDRSPRLPEAPARLMMMPPADHSQGARADTRRMVMPPADHSQGARADTRRVVIPTANNKINIEMLPPPNRIPTLSGLTPSELPPRKRGITVDQISREAKGKGKLYEE